MNVTEIKPLWEHQKKAIAEALTHRDFAFFMSMGTGKTLTLITTLRHQYTKNKRVMRTLILAPPITLRNWKAEWEMGSKIGDKVSVLHGPQKKRILEVGKNPILVTNYESLIMKDLYKALQEWGPEIIVFDESHKIKEISSKRTKNAVALATEAKHCYLLSGTPILNSPLDIFSQYKAMDRGETFGTNFYSFRATYMYDVNASMPRHKYFPNWKIKPNALDQINEKIYRKAIRVTKEECLDLPPLVRETVGVELSPEQKRAYEEMKKDFIAYVQGEACVASIALTKALKLMQIVTGFVNVSDEKAIQLDASPRINALQELLESITPHSKVLIWCVFKENYKAIRALCEKLKLRSVEVHGDVSNNKKFEAVDQFNNDPDLPVFIGHPGSGGIGINLVSASYSIFYSRNFSLENDLQAESRNHRAGSEKHNKITRIDIVTPETIDEAILKRLAQKQEISQKILRDISLEL